MKTKEIIEKFGIVNFSLIIVGIILVAILAHMPIKIDETILTKSIEEVSMPEIRKFIFYLISIGITIIGFFNGMISFLKRQ